MTTWLSFVIAYAVGVVLLTENPAVNKALLSEKVFKDCLKTGGEFFLHAAVLFGFEAFAASLLPQKPEAEIITAVFFLAAYGLTKLRRLPYPLYAVLFAYRLFLQHAMIFGTFFLGIAITGVFAIVGTLCVILLRGTIAHFELTPPIDAMRGLPLLFLMACFMAVSLSGFFSL